MKGKQIKRICNVSNRYIRKWKQGEKVQIPEHTIVKSLRLGYWFLYELDNSDSGGRGKKSTTQIEVPDRETNDVINLMRDIPVVVVVGSASGGENNKTTSG